MSLDYMNNKNSKYKAFNSFIFCGSASIGVMNAGYNLEKVLEISEEMEKQNAYHFKKNFDNIPLIKPSEWENTPYLESMKKQNYDFCMFNCPCSSLSQINRNASLDGKNNQHFYRVFNIIKQTLPKTFVIENAPTLIKLGYPIIKDMINELGKDYKFSIIRDYAGNHNVAMKRMRTLLVGWRKDTFNNKIPLLHMDKQKPFTTKDAIGDFYDVDINNNNIKNFNILNDEWDSISQYFSYVPENSSILLSLIDNWNAIKDEIDNKSIVSQVEKTKEKLDKNQRIWDKSPWRPSENVPCPSMTSVTKIIHPVKDRSFTIREYARLMNYPDDFEFFPDECETDIIQCITQGVPANFITYIAKEVFEALEGNRTYIENSDNDTLCFQYNTQKCYQTFNLEQLNEMKCLDSDKTFKKLEK